MKSWIITLPSGQQTANIEQNPLHNRFSHKTDTDTDTTQWQYEKQTDEAGTAHGHGNKRRRYAAAAICFLLSAGILFWFAMEREAASRQASIAAKILRLHVLANSDDAEDQSLKLKVRDGILAYMSVHAPAFDNVTEAKTWTTAHMKELQQTAEQIIRTQGHAEPVTLELTSCYFPVKTYGDLTFPSGTYEALRVRIGAAKGQNWWCVMYPPLCFTDATCGTFPETSKEILEQQLTTEEFLSLCRKSEENRQEPPEIRFKLLDLLLK